MLPFKKFSGLHPKPRWGAQRPPPPPPQTPTCKAPPFTAGYAPGVVCWSILQIYYNFYSFGHWRSWINLCCRESSMVSIFLHDLSLITKCAFSSFDCLEPTWEKVQILLEMNRFLILPLGIQLFLCLWTKSRKESEWKFCSIFLFFHVTLFVFCFVLFVCFWNHWQSRHALFLMPFTFFSICFHLPSVDEDTTADTAEPSDVTVDESLFQDIGDLDLDDEDLS